MEDLDKSLRVLTYYHTAIRNMALYASVAFAALVYSRFHRGKNFLINVILIVSSIIFTILSIIIGHYLKEDLHSIEVKEKIQSLEKWYLVPNILIYTNYAILLSTLYVFFIQFS